MVFSISSVSGATPMTPAKGFKRNANAGRELDLVLRLVERERLEHARAEFAGQESEIRMILHPSPVGGLELEQANGEHIARVRAFDIDRPVSVWIQSQSMLAVSPVVDVGVTCPPVASCVNASMMLPDGTRIAGAIRRLNLVCVWSLVSTKSGFRADAAASLFPDAHEPQPADRIRHAASTPTPWSAP